MNDYENAILEQQESVSEDCATCEYKCNCCSQCTEITEIYNPNLHWFIGSNIAHKNFSCVLFSTYKQRTTEREVQTMLKKLFSRKNPYTTAIKKDIVEIKAMSKQYEETRKQVLKNVETINALMGR